MEALSTILNQVKEEGFVTGFSIDRRRAEMESSHLLFANDTLILGDATKEQEEYLS